MVILLLALRHCDARLYAILGINKWRSEQKGKNMHYVVEWGY